MFKQLCIIGILHFSKLLAFGQAWLPLDQGVGGCLSGHHIHSLCYDPTAEKLHVTGTFSADSNCNTMRGFATWNGEQFDSIANNNPSVQCTAQIIHNNVLYGATLFFETFQESFNLARFEGGQWVPLQNAPNSVIECAFSFENYVYFGGGFIECEGAACFMLCSFDGETFTPLVTNGFVEEGWRVLDLTFYQGQLIAGGRFEMLDENSQSVWNLGVVSDGWLHSFPVPLSAASIVEALQVHDGDLYIAGLLTPEGESDYRSIMKWDGTNLTDLSSYDYGEIVGPFNERLTDMEVHNGKLYVAGWFDQLEGQPCQGVACWDGTTWECLNTEIIWPLWSAVSDIEIIDDTLYMAGDFITIGTDTLHCIAKLNQKLTGNDDLSVQSGIDLFPNPSSDFLTLETETYIDKDVSIETFNSIGQKVYTATWLAGEKKKQIHVEHLSNGLYFISIATESESHNLKFVKQ
ncbi:MAG: T9SS type A sorting domain-containing protein [Flavobacteriales bacterium]|nr:T9SS type A sorting domain-containing protein [Flavobacteriales bacterium]